MNDEEKKVGLVFTGGLKRLPAHIGAILRYKEEEKAGKVPRPFFVIGSSAGAIIAASIVPWNEKSLNRVAQLIIDLKRSQVFNIRHLIELFGVMTVAEDFANFLPGIFSNKWSGKKKIYLELAKSGLSVGTKVALFYKLLEQPSLFSNKPLGKLLQKNLDYKSFWELGEGPQAIKIEIPAVDLISKEPWYFTNYLPAHRELYCRDEVLLKTILASSSIPAHFPPVQLENMLLDDAAIRINAPIHRAVLAGCQKIFVFCHTPFHESAPPPINWAEELTRCLDISIAENTRKTVEGHQSINYNLGVLEKIEEYLKNEITPGAVRARELLKEFDFATCRRTELINVVSNKTLPDFDLHSFTPEKMKYALELGYDAMDQALKYKGL